MGHSWFCPPGQAGTSLCLPPGQGRAGRCFISRSSGPRPRPALPSSLFPPSPCPLSLSLCPSQPLSLRHFCLYILACSIHICPLKPPGSTFWVVPRGVRAYQTQNLGFQYCVILAARGRLAHSPCLSERWGSPKGWGPHPFSLPAEGQGCTAYDVAVNSDFYRRMQVGGEAAGGAWAGAAPFTPEPSRSPAPRSVLEQRFPA